MRQFNRKHCQSPIQILQIRDCSVDEGTDYLRKCGDREDWEELSVIEE